MEEMKLFSRPFLLCLQQGGAGCGRIICALGSYKLWHKSVIAVRPLEFPSWLCGCRNWGLVCVFSYQWVALRLLVFVQKPCSLHCSCSC